MCQSRENRQMKRSHPSSLTVGLFCILNRKTPKNKSIKKTQKSIKKKSLKRSSQTSCFWLLDGKLAFSQHEHVCKWLQSLRTQIWSSHLEITNVDRHGGDLRNKLELFADWTNSWWERKKAEQNGPTAKYSEMLSRSSKCYTAPIFCNSFPWNKNASRKRFQGQALPPHT